MPKRTRAQKQRAHSHRSTQGRSTASLSVPAAAPPAPQSQLNENQAERFFGYSPRLIWSDLQKTVLVTIAIFGLLGVITWYLR